MPKQGTGTEITRPPKEKPSAEAESGADREAAMSEIITIFGKCRIFS